MRKKLLAATIVVAVAPVGGCFKKPAKPPQAAARQDTIAGTNLSVSHGTAPPLRTTAPAPGYRSTLNSQSAQADAAFYAAQAKTHDQDVQRHTPLCSPTAKVKAPAGACREP